MNWVKENKFLTGYIAFMVIGVGALGYEVYSASSADDEASAKYTSTAAEYNRLRGLAPFPSRQNLDAYDDQKKQAGEIINAFEADLSRKEFPLETMTPSGFQDKLKASVSAVRKKAEEAGGIKLPEKFYLAFEKYESVPPSTEAATPLGRELKSIEWVVNQFLSQSAATIPAITELKRADLPEEGGGRQTQRGGGQGGQGSFGSQGGQSGPGGRGPTSSNGPGGPGRNGPGGSGRRNSDLVRYHSFDISVLCKPDGLRNALNSVTASNAPQFFVLRNIKIRNQAEKGPSRAGDPNKQPDAKDKEMAATYVVGTELIEVTARFDMVDFTSPSEKVASEDSSSSPSPVSTPARR